MPQTFQNRTIDDESGDSVSGAKPVYSPPTYWSLNSSCDGCKVHPNASLAFNRTWHDSSQLPGNGPVSITLEFTGTAIYVYCIVPPVIPGVVSLYNLNFTLDGADSGRFHFSPTSTADYLYNVPALSLPSIPNQKHSLVMSTDNSVDGSIFLFDYAIYTTVEAKPDRHIGGAIAGGVLGGVILVLLILGFVFLRRRRQRSRTLPAFPAQTEKPVPPSTLPYIIEPFSANSQNGRSNTSSPLPSGSNGSTADSEMASGIPGAIARQLQQVLDAVTDLRQKPNHSEAGSASTPANAVDAEAAYPGPASLPPVYDSIPGVGRPRPLPAPTPSYSSPSKS
ncbi:hypothetical protein C8J57DRAFT_260268 [Mycena rebaudengoi]|nr:hypothetical protein C8J57DRAFT_260268 [Mycena rebaudengoi]